MDSRIGVGMLAGGEAAARSHLADGVKVKNVYTFECYDKDGNLKWVDTIENLVTNEGLNDLLDKYLKGSAYTAAWYLGLMAGGSPAPAPAASDTLASHPGWTEFTAFSNSPNVRQTLTLGAVASQSVDNSASKASFTIAVESPDSQTIGGAFLTTDPAIGNSSPVGVLYSAAAFSGGDKMLNGGDVLNVTATCTAASA